MKHLDHEDSPTILEEQAFHNTVQEYIIFLLFRTPLPYKESPVGCQLLLPARLPSQWQGWRFGGERWSDGAKGQFGSVNVCPICLCRSCPPPANLSPQQWNPSLSQQLLCEVAQLFANQWLVESSSTYPSLFFCRLLTFSVNLKVLQGNRHWWEGFIKLLLFRLCWLS